ncbi:UPF0702 transmembrane protein YrbG [Sporosarcina sp. NCCP-2716]|uniref:DUF421 domain-containing protein n=1 Tax=Sporosarcina sp. NCCP-2716 TaxID=2943679 RepID=UPI00203E358B|nr:DUF421 domain-containing protein [Sporosarcina sp. NCCP-2716]GKV68760.1 UPF0702 transmembrane protein YrbG [Sporosarcina sp. NCCP-2716]
MPDLLIIAFRTVFLYALIVLVLRLMGKREVGELSVIDIVVFIIIAEVAAFALDSPDEKLINSILPMFILLVIQYTSSYISLKNKKFRDLVDGDTSVLIRDGIIQEEEMRKQRYNLDDLFQQLREQQIGSLYEVAYAYLEPSGNLSVFKQGETAPVLPLILDGDIDPEHLSVYDKTEEWLRAELTKTGITDPSQVFYCSFEQGQLKVQLKHDYL